MRSRGLRADQSTAGPNADCALLKENLIDITDCKLDIWLCLSCRHEQWPVSSGVCYSPAHQNCLFDSGQIVVAGSS